MKPFFLTYFFLCFFTVYANDGQSLGARLAALGNASVAANDAWSIQHNQAGIAYLEQTSFAFSVENRFGLSELNLGGVIAVMPTDFGVFGVSVAHAGDILYNESAVGIAYARSFGKSVSAGLKFNYTNTHLGNGYGKRNVLLVEGGLQVKLNKELTIGAHVFNPNRTLLSKDYDERYPTSFRIGFQYDVSDKVLLLGEAEKQTDQKLIGKVGLEYQLVSALYLRTGISTNPIQNSFGFGCILQQFQIDLAIWKHYQLGYVPQFSITYQIGK